MKSGSVPFLKMSTIIIEAETGTKIIKETDNLKLLTTDQSICESKNQMTEKSLVGQGIQNHHIVIIMSFLFLSSNKSEYIMIPTFT